LDGLRRTKLNPQIINHFHPIPCNPLASANGSAFSVMARIFSGYPLDCVGDISRGAHFLKTTIILVLYRNHGNSDTRSMGRATDDKADWFR
jgi:hypothetical protein